MNQAKLEKMLRSLKRDGHHARRLSKAELPLVVRLDRIANESGYGWRYPTTQDRKLQVTRFFNKIETAKTYDDIEFATWHCFISQSCLYETPLIWQKFMEKWNAVVSFWSQHRDIEL